MSLSEAQKRHLRGLAHHLRPCVQIGQAGITPGLLAELDGALSHHELLKVRIQAAGGRDARDTLLQELLKASGATLVSRIGHVAVLYRPDADGPRLVLP